MRSIPGTITQYVQDQDQVEELDLSRPEVLALRRTKAEIRASETQRRLDEERAIVAAYDREIEGIA